MNEKFERKKCRRVTLNEYMNEMSDRTRCENDETKCDICRDSIDEVDEKKKMNCETMKKDIDNIVKLKIDLKRTINAKKKHETKNEMINDDEKSENERQNNDKTKNVYRRQ